MMAFNTTATLPPKSKKHVKENMINIVSQAVNGMVHSWKLEHLIQNMMDNNIDAYLIQEIWLPGKWEKEICGYLIIYHDHRVEKGKEKIVRSKRKRNREKRHHNHPLAFLSTSL